MKYLGCIAAPPVPGKDAATDVAAFAFQAFIEPFSSNS